MVKKLFSRMVTCVLLAFMAFTANAAAKIRLQFVFDKGAMDYISQAGADYDDFAASCVTRMNTVLTNSRLNDYFTYELAGTTLLPGVDNTNPATGYTEGWAALCGNRGDEWAGMLNDRYEKAADVVVLLINTGSYAGATGNSHPFTGSGAEYAINYAGSAFSVCSIMTAAREIEGVASGHQVLSHEVAHTLGCGHPDTQDRQPGPQSTTYASGMQFKLPQGKETALPPSASVTQDVTAYYGTTLMGYSERFFKHTDGTYMTRAEVLAETGWTDAGEGEVYWDNTNGEYGSSYPNGVWTYCYIVPYFSSPDLYFSNVTVPYGMELTDGVVTVYGQNQYDAMSAEDKAKLVPMGDATHNNRQVLIDNCQYASRWHLGVKFSKEGNASVVNGKSDKITLTPLSKGLTIYYTTDGTEPTKENGTLYTEPFSLTQAATVKARSYDADGNAGDVLSKSYTILPLATALGNTELTWTTTSPAWYVDGDGVARSALISSDGVTSTLSTVINGPAKLTFEYAAELMDSDVFAVTVGGTKVLEATEYNSEFVSSGEITIPEGNQDVVFSFTVNFNMFSGNHIKVRNVSVTYGSIPDSDDLVYTGPEPTVVWEAGEFKRTKNGYSIELNGNTIDKDGNIVIDGSSSAGATIKLLDIAPNATKITVLYKYKSMTAPNNADCRYAVSTCYESSSEKIDMGLINWNNTNPGLLPAWHKNNGSTIYDNAFYTYSDSKPAYTQAMSANGGYVLFSFSQDAKQLAGYQGAAINNLEGGVKGGISFTGYNKLSYIGLGGPTGKTVSNKWGAWPDLVIEKVAIFVDEVVSNEDIANYKFPDLPIDPDDYAVTPAAVWYKDFDITQKGDYSLSLGDNSINDKKNVVIESSASAGVCVDLPDPTRTITVLVKYAGAPLQSSSRFLVCGNFATSTSVVDLGLVSLRSNDSTLLAGYCTATTSSATTFGTPVVPSVSDGGYVLFAHNASDSIASYGAASLSGLCADGAGSTVKYSFSSYQYNSIAVGGPTGKMNGSKWGVWEGLEIEKIVVFDGYYTPADLIAVDIPENAATLSIGAGATWNFAAGETKTYTKIGTLDAGGTIAITNAATLGIGVYKLAEWITPQQFTTTTNGYGRVGNVLLEGFNGDLAAELVYGARAIYLRVYDPVAQAKLKTLTIWPYGDSITEGFNGEHTGANYRILLYQKLRMLGFNVKSAGVYGLNDGYNSIDPSGEPLSDTDRWHSAKHGGTVGPTTNTKRSNECENVDTLCAQVGTPDVVLLHIGSNDLNESVTNADKDDEIVNGAFKAWSNVVSRLVKNLPDTKIIVSTGLDGVNSTRARLNERMHAYNTCITNLVHNLPEDMQGHVYLANLYDYVDSQTTGILYTNGGDNLHPDWWGHDQMAEGWLSVITNQFSNTDNFVSAEPIPAAPEENQLGAAAKNELSAYLDGFKRYAVLNADKNILPTLDMAIPYTQVNDEAATTALEKVGYFVEYVRDDNHAHRWVWVDMDAFGTTIEDVGLPKAKHRQKVSNLHVKSNHGGIDNVAANTEGVEGWIEFSPFGYDRAPSNVDGAPADNGSSSYDWNDTLNDSGSLACMQVFRLAPPSGRPAQVLFAYNNWRNSGSEAEFGIGNFSQHFSTGNYQSFDYSTTSSLDRMNATNYVVKTIEIWTKRACTVTFDAGEYGSISEGSVQQVAYGATASAPTVTPAAGWSFIGWDGDTSAAITEDMTFTAQYSANVVPGTLSQEEMTQQNVVLDEKGEWALIDKKPIFFTVPSQTNVFTVSFEVYVPNDTAVGSLFGFAMTNKNSNAAVSEIRVRRNDSKYLVGAHSGTTEMGKDGSGNDQFEGGTTSLGPGEHTILIEYDHQNNVNPENIRGTTIYLDGTQVYHSTALSWRNRKTPLFAIGGAAIESTPTDVFTGLKVKNLVFADGVVSKASYVAEGEEEAKLTPKQAVIYETKVRGKESEVKSSLKLNGKSGLSSADGARLIDYFDLDNIETNVVFEVESFDLSSDLEGGTITPKMNPPLKHGTLWLLGSDDLKTWNDVTSQSENGEFEIDNDYNFFKFEIRD